MNNFIPREDFKTLQNRMSEFTHQLKTKPLEICVKNCWKDLSFRTNFSISLKTYLKSIFLDQLIEVHGEEFKCHTDMIAKSETFEHMYKVHIIISVLKVRFKNLQNNKGKDRFLSPFDFVR